MLTQDLKQRGLIYDVSDESLYTALDTEHLTFYLGADPTGDSLHVGHLATYLVAKRLMDAGHHPILVIGGGTGLIGDPSGKSKERNLLALEDSLKNAEAISKQVKKLLPEAKVVNNYDWLKHVSMIDFLRLIGKDFNLNQMLAKDTVKRRLESGISYTEFSYQIIQSMDFLELYQSHDCVLQIGGQDQWGNITAGLELIRKQHPEGKKAYGMVFPLITKSDGSKFGKTADGAVWLDPLKTSPYSFYQYFVNLPDDEAKEMLKKFSFEPLETIESINALMEESAHKRHAQKALASEMTQLVHGEEGLNSARLITDALFNGDFSKLSKDDFKIAFAGAPSTQIASKTPLLEALVKAKVAPSNSQARTLIKQNAIAINGVKVTDDEYLLDKNDAYYQTYTVIKKGKKSMFLCEIT